MSLFRTGPMSYKDPIKNYVTFSVREQRGIFLLSVILMLLILLRVGMPHLMARRSYDFSSFEKQAQLLDALITDSIPDDKAERPSKEPGQLRSPRKKMISGPVTPGAKQESTGKQTRIDLNAADSLALVRLRGIGPVLASRILKYRESLGGYTDVNQLKEIYGIDTLMLGEVIPLLYVDGTTIRRMNLNTASFKELLRHPYLEYDDVKRIVNYRDKHHPIDSLDVLFSIEGLPPELVSRILPYLTTGL